MAADTKELDAYRSDIAAYRKILEEIVQCSRVLLENPNCRYIHNLAEGALKKTVKAQIIAKTAISCK